MILAHAPLAHQRMCDRYLERFGKRREFVGRPRGDHASSRINQRMLRVSQHLRDALRRRVVDRRSRNFRRHLTKRVEGKIRRQEVHGNVNEHGSRPAGRGDVECAFDDAREIRGALDAIHTLAERPVDLALVGILVKVELLMRVTAVVVRGNITGDHDHRDRVERGIGDAGDRIRQSWPEMTQDDAWFA
jgi:hypothetical protein